ncbi:Disease resistance protein [Corchorus olitorius]|uniref:Disease resistance protein n=1 Tax=Corchorus olitorius TaxID=93759 RepID=A0A1R3G2B9_9ROSI|nr:Disease resistance protein [Corchorus olitorius]
MHMASELSFLWMMLEVPRQVLHFCLFGMPSSVWFLASAY